MNYVEWIRELDKGGCSGTYLVKVTEPFLWESMKETIKRDLLNNLLLEFNFRQINFQDLDAEIFQTALETMPMVANHKAIVLENIPLTKNDIKSCETFLESLLSYLEAANDRTILFLHFNGESPFKGKYLKKILPYVKEVELYRLKRDGLESFIHKRFLAASIKEDRRVPGLIADKSSYLEYKSDKNLYHVASMVDVAIGMAKDGVLKLSDAEEALRDPLEDSIFALMDAFSTKNTPLCLKTLSDFQRQSIDPVAIFYMLARQVRKLIGVKLLTKNRVSPATAQKRLSLSNFEYRKLERNINNFKLEELLKMHDFLFESDVKFKTESFDLYKNMEIFFSGLTST